MPDSKPPATVFSCGAIVSSHIKSTTKQFYGNASCQLGGMLKSKMKKKSQNKIKKMNFCSIKKEKKKTLKSLKEPNQKKH